MVKRNKLLSIVESGNHVDLTAFVKECKSESTSMISETLTSCSRQQLDVIWSKVHSILEGLNDENLLTEECDGSSLAGFIPSVTALMMALVSQKQVPYVPDALIQTAVLLQEVLPKLPMEADKVWNGAAQVFELWWKKHLPNRDSLVMTTYNFLLQRSLELSPKPVLADVKRAWSLHEVLYLVDFTSSTSRDFVCLVQRCFLSQLYVTQDEGVKFLSFVMTLDDRLTCEIHKTIKNNLLVAPRWWAEKYGEMYFRAWQGLDGACRGRFEQQCIQELMSCAIHAQPVMAPPLRKLLGYLHSQKKQKGVDDMLCRLYAPIMWRSLRVANSQVRANAAFLFFSVFPLQDSSMDMENADAFLQNQFDFFYELLEDPYPSVRSLSVLRVFTVMQTYWEMIPDTILKNLLVKLLHEKLRDWNSAEVRESVVKGITLLLDNGLSHMCLKTLLPGIRDSFHDVSEKVRLAMLNLLNKVKTLRSIKYWSIVPVDHLLARLVVDSEPVNRRIMNLLFTSFLPIDAPLDVQVSRCVVLIEANPAAARQFFRYAPKHMDLNDTVKYINTLCKAIIFAIKRSEENKQDKCANPSGQSMADDSVSSSDASGTKADGKSTSGNEADEARSFEADGSQDEEEDEISITDKPLMLGLCEAMHILWNRIDDDLQKPSNADLKKKLQKKFSYVLPEMMRVFNDNDIVAVLLQLAVHLPANFIPTISRTWLPKLRKMTSSTPQSEYSTLLETICKSGGTPEVIELCTEWISSVLVEKSEEPIRKAGKKKRVGFTLQTDPQPRLGVDMLDYVTASCQLQHILLQYIFDNPGLTDLLKSCMKQLSAWFQGDESRKTPEQVEMLADMFSLYCKLLLQLHGMDPANHDCLDAYRNLITWADKMAVPVLSMKSEEEGENRHRDMAIRLLETLLCAVSNMFRIGIGHVLFEEVMDFCTGCLAADENLQLLGPVMQCLYQGVELDKCSADKPSLLPDEHVAQDGEEMNTVVTGLSRILVNIVAYVNKHPEQCSKRLSSVSGLFSNLFNVMFVHLPLHETVLHDVMSTLLVSILAEMTHCSKQLDLEDEALLTTLPALSGWLVEILVRKAITAEMLVDELRRCSEAGSLDGMHCLHGAVHLLAVLCSDKTKIRGLKDVWTTIHMQTDKQTAELTDADKEDLKPVLLALESKMKICQTSLGMIPS